MEQVTGVEPAYAAWEGTLRTPENRLFSGFFGDSYTRTSRVTSRFELVPALST